MCNTKATLHTTTANLSLMKAKAHIFNAHEDYYNYECARNKRNGDIHNTRLQTGRRKKSVWAEAS